jgi:large subunit ribosomal protein L16
MFQVDNSGPAKGAKEINFLSYGLQTTTKGIIKSNQFEAARKALTKEMKKDGKIIFRVWPQISYTKKPLEVRMGAGKGSVSFYAAPVKAGTVIIELEHNSEAVARRAAKLASDKLPVKTKFIKKSVVENQIKEV